MKSAQRRPGRAAWWLVALCSACAFANAARAQAVAAPCISATATCSEWIAIEGQPQRLQVYRSYPLDVRNDGVQRALVMVHGGLRLAADQFTNELAAAFIDGALGDTVLVAPRFASNTSAPSSTDPFACLDALAAEEANWICEDARADSWRNGSPATGNPNVTSFDFADEIVRRLADKTTFPNLKHIVIAGHSGGGQYALRYAMATRIHEIAGPSVSYVVSNPDALIYLDGLRPTPAAYPPAAAGPRFLPPVSGEPFVPFADARNCATFDDWQYGLRGRAGYTAALTDEQLQRQLASRPVTYLLGGADIVPFGGFDDSCPAMAQGPTRLARGLAYAAYINERYGARHQVVVVDACGHDDRCMFTSKQALPLLFPRL
jgi:pimeloyl-ACP methyl ester carboxylesterase